MNFDFDGLFILDLANNHDGSVDKAKAIIDSMRLTSLPPKTAIKVQLRHLDTFIHPDYRDSKQAQRFLGTRLSDEQFTEIVEYISGNHYFVAATPFDERSVDLACKFGSDILKVASCSANDWPLIQEVAKAGKPTVFSTGGLTIAEVDNIVSFCDHKGVDFALHHCVSIYPTPLDALNLGRIAEFKRRYPGVTIGWSTHEDQNDNSIIKVAYALGARMFERHISIGDRNAYSSDSEQIENWIGGYFQVRDMLQPPTQEVIRAEREDLKKLRRGRYAQGLMMPAGLPDELPPEKDVSPAFLLKQSIHKIKAIINYANVALPPDFETEYSHHYGVELFEETGVTMIEILNRHYAKKLLIMLPGQAHPSHYHKIKDEAFCLIWGDLNVTIDGKDFAMVPGETMIVPPGTWHSFSSETGCVFEEVSTTSISGDSVYADPYINTLSMQQRKTKVRKWGRYDLEEILK